MGPGSCQQSTISAGATNSKLFNLFLEPLKHVNQNNLSGLSDQEELFLVISRLTATWQFNVRQ